MNELEEIWKEVDGHPNYQVSNFGRVKSYAIYSMGKIMKETIHKSGYIYYKLKRANEITNITIHRLVAIHFIPRDENIKLEVNHKDGNKLNNRANNLEWVSRSENVKHSFINKLHIPKMGIECHTNKLSEIDVREIIELLKTSNLRVCDIARLYNVCWSTINYIKLNKSWKHIPR